MTQIRLFSLFLVVISIVLGLAVSSTNNNILAQQQQQNGGGDALALIIQYQYVVQTDIPFDSNQLMTEIFAKTSQPASSTFTVLSRSLAPTTAGTSIATATYILKVQLDVYAVYNGILNRTQLVVTNSTAGSTEIDFLGNTIKIIGLSASTDAPAVDARYPGESLGVATIVTVAIVGAFLALFIFGMIKYNRADNKTMEAMWNEKILSESRDNNNNNNNINVRNNVSFQSDNLINEGQLEIISQRRPSSNSEAATVSNFARSTTSADQSSQPDLHAKNIQHDDIPDL